MVEKGDEHGKPVRIGVNWGRGSEPLRRMMARPRAQQPSSRRVMREALIVSALESAKRRGLVLARERRDLVQGLRRQD